MMMVNHWHEANQAYLMAALACVREALEHQAEKGATPLQGNVTTFTPSMQVQQEFQQAMQTIPAPAALDQICSTFGLSTFERDVLLLCVGIELDSRFAALCAKAQGDPQRAYPTFSLALAALPGAHWSALSPKAPLRYWQILDVGSGKALTLSPLRVDERILHALTGVHHLDERLTPIVKPIRTVEPLVPSHQALATQLAAIWRPKLGKATLPIVQLCGEEASSHRAIAATACTELGLNLHRLSTVALPTNPTDLSQLIRAWEREAILSRSALLIDCHDLESTEAAPNSAIARLLEEITGPLMVASRDRRRPPQRSFVTLEVQSPTTHEQRLLWQTALPPLHLDGTIDRLVSQFNLTPSTVQAVSIETLGQFQGIPQVMPSEPTSTVPTEAIESALWDSCRAQARPRLDELAQRIESSARWDDLVLPDAQRQVLKDIAAHVRQRTRVYEQWGLGSKNGRGLGFSALFAGASGTGKTMAAEVLSQELQLDLYRIDLSSVVSKYIGETEKNLRRVFDAAEVGGVILLFDEADALFGKRSEVKDSHDRYANMEVSYLLQRMESYRGLAILTTNLKDSIDQAFLRRLRFIVKFPFPDSAQRAEIWRRVFPPSAPTAGLDANKLAQLNVAGGNIRSIALNAAFIAADAGDPICMKHLLAAAQGEYTKLERSLTSTEVKGWV